MKFQEFGEEAGGVVDVQWQWCDHGSKVIIHKLRDVLSG